MTKAPLAVRRLSGAILVGLLTVAMLVATAPASTSSPSSAADKIDRALAAQLAGGRSATFWVELGARADLSSAATVKDWNARGLAVMRALMTTAGASQAGVKAMLASRGVDVPLVLDLEHDPGDRERRPRGEPRRPARGGPADPGPRLPARADQGGHSLGSRRRRRVEHRQHQRRRRLVQLRHDRGRHRRGQHRHRRPLHPRRLGSGVPRQEARGWLQPQLRLVGPVAHLQLPREEALRQQRPRHPHHGHHGRRRRRVEPDRRRSRREVDRRQGLRDEHLLEHRPAVRRRSGSWRPTKTDGSQPEARPAPEHREQLVGRRRWRQLVRGLGERLDRGRHLPAVLQRQPRARLRLVGVARRLHPELPAGAFDINNAIASFSRRGPSAFSQRDQAEHLRARA